MPARRPRERGDPLLLIFPAIAAIALAFAATAVQAACLAITAVPEGRALTTLTVPAATPTFDITYVHSVTHRLIVESYRVDGGALVETSIVFDQHGPGLPTAPDEGQTWTDRDGRFIVTLARRFDDLRIRVHRDQVWQLLIGGKTVDLAQWGNRAIEVRVAACDDAVSTSESNDAGSPPSRGRRTDTPASSLAPERRAVMLHRQSTDIR